MHSLHFSAAETRRLVYFSPLLERTKKWQNAVSCMRIAQVALQLLFLKLSKRTQKVSPIFLPPASTHCILWERKLIRVHAVLKQRSDTVFAKGKCPHKVRVLRLENTLWFVPLGPESGVCRKPFSSYGMKRERSLKRMFVSCILGVRMLCVCSMFSIFDFFFEFQTWNKHSFG